ncbi:hypothetical protein [Mycoplasmopsis synoviae]|uniref:hypothetical protein n=1 Tax=Mycoplasmopsis synoviae TaxID=2109 RepID=UPI003562E150
MAKDLGISHVSLIKEIKKTQVNMDMMPSLLENHDIRIAKNHFKLKSEIYKFKALEKFLKIYNAKEIPVESTAEFIKQSYSINAFN